MDDRRRYERAKVACPLQVKAIAVDSPVIRNSFCNNMSPVGMAFTSFDFYPVDGKVHLNILSAAMNKVMEVIGRVVWVREIPHQNRYKIGVEFEDCSDSFVDKVKKFITNGLEG